MPKVKSSAKAHTSAIPDQEIDVPIPMKKVQALTMSQKRSLILSKQITSSQSSNAEYVHALYRGTKNGLDS